VRNESVRLWHGIFSLSEKSRSRAGSLPHFLRGEGLFPKRLNACFLGLYWRSERNLILERFT